MNYSVCLTLCLAFLLICSIVVLSAYAQPVTNTKIALVGDISGTAIRDSINERNPDLVVALGDLGYKSSLSTFKKDYGMFNLKCLVGNHDSAEDSGGAPIVKEAPAYCGDWWNAKIGKATMLFGFNTNGDLNKQLQAAKKVSIKGIKTLIIMTHKPCYTTPNSHHPVEPNVKSFCDSFASSIPAGIKVYYIRTQPSTRFDGRRYEILKRWRWKKPLRLWNGCSLELLR